MIRICSQCRSFLGTKPPYDDHSTTHTLCQVCIQQYADELKALAIGNAQLQAEGYR